MGTMFLFVRHVPEAVLLQALDVPEPSLLAYYKLLFAAAKEIPDAVPQAVVEMCKRINSGKPDFWFNADQEPDALCGQCGEETPLVTFVCHKTAWLCAECYLENPQLHCMVQGCTNRVVKLNSDVAPASPVT